MKKIYLVVLILLFYMSAYAGEDLVLKVGMKFEDAQKMLKQAGAQEVAMDMEYLPEGSSEILNTYGLPAPDTRALAITSKKLAVGFVITHIELCTNCDLPKKFRDWHTVREVNLSHSEEFTVKHVSPREVQMPFLLKEAAVPKTMFAVDFQDGFNNERVILYVEGEQVFSKNITSNPILSLADSIKVKKKGAIVDLTILLPEKKTKWICGIDFSKGPYIGIQQVAEEIIINQSKEPFLYE